MSEQDYPTEVKRWDVFEVSLEGPSDGNPFLEQKLQGIFTGKNESVVTEGFYDGNGIYKIRFMPSFSGRYSFILKGSFFTESLSGRFVVNEADAKNHGPVRTANTYHFAYEDGQAYYPIGTTSNNWHLKYDGDIAASLKTIKESGFNKVRFSVFPYHNEYHLDDPQYFPYDGTPMSPHVLTKDNVQEYTGKNENNQFQYTRFNTEYFKHLETCIQELSKVGIETDLVLFHPYDRWGFDQMNEQENDLYLSYVVNRLSGYHNVWWSLADGWDEDQNKSLKDWEHYADLLVRKDPYHHLRSIHNCHEVYDCTRPWITHASIGSDDLYRSAEYVDAYRLRFHKPIIMENLGGEGNTASGWDSLSPEEMTRRFWETAMRGGYPGHREMYVDDNEHIWSQHGTKLVGESWQRAIFLRRILEEVPGNGLISMNTCHDCCACVPEAEASLPIKTQYLYYFSFLRPAYREFYIDDDTDYVVEIIDTYDMKVKRYGICKGHFTVELPLKSYLCIRLRKSQEEDYNYVEPVEEVIEEVTPIEAPFAEETEIEEPFKEEPVAEETEPVQEEVTEPQEEVELTETVKLPVTEQAEEPIEEPEAVDQQLEPEAIPVAEENDGLQVEQFLHKEEPVVEEPVTEPTPIEAEQPVQEKEEIDFSSIPEFSTDELIGGDEETANTDTIKQEMENNEVNEEDDDELPEIISDSYMATHK